MSAFKTNTELLQIDEFVSGPRQLSLKVHLKFCKVIPNPNAALEVYAHPWPNPKALVTILRQTYSRPFVAFHIINGGQLADLESLIEQTCHFLEEFDELLLWHTDYDICTHVCDFLSQKFDVASPPSLNFAFFIPPEKQKEISKMDITLPEGFTFCELNPEGDHLFLTNTWKYSAKTEAPNIKAKLEHLPSIGVKFDGKLVAFEIMHHTGAMNHLYTVPEFRCKGIGRTVELKLAQIIINMGIMPLKTVTIGEELAMLLTDKSSYWNKVVDEETKKQIVIDFRILYRK